MPTRLRKGDITLKQLLNLSRKAYAMNDIDNKKKRSKLDILGAKLTLRKNVSYNFSTKVWEQTGRNVKLVFLIRTKPVSYKTPKWDTKIHKYPVIFLFRDWDKGIHSPVKIRVGSNYKPKFPRRKISEQKDKNMKDAVRKENQKIAEYNLSKGIQLQFFFDSMFLYKANRLLYGVNYAIGPPKKSNPKGLLYFSKHEFFIVTRILPRLFNSPRINAIVKNDN